MEYKPIKVNDKTELAYDIIKELDSLREDVAIRINTMEEKTKELLEKLEDSTPKVNPMYDDEYFKQYPDDEKKESESKLLNARLEKR